MLHYANLGAIRRFWYVIVGMGLIGALLAFLVSLTITPLYRATTQLYFTLNFGNTASDLAQGSTYTTNQMTSFGELATTPVVLEPVIKKLNLDMTASDLAKVVTVSTPRDTVIMQISAISVDPETAAQIANAVGVQAGSTIEELAPRMQNGKPSVQVRTVAEALPPQFQFVPDKRLNTIGGLLLGGVVGVAATFILGALDNRVRNADSLQQITKAPYLGTLGLRPDSAGREAVVLQDPSSHAAEEYRQVRSSLRFATLSKHPLMLVVSSAVPGEGKTTVATNLAATLAESGQKVLLIDADLRKPRVADYVHVINAIGLCDVLVDEVTLTAAVQPLGTSGVEVLTSGDIPPNPGELVASTRMAELLTEARARYDVVIIDTAPILAVADALSLTHNADGIVLVVRPGSTLKRDLEASVDTVEAAGETVFGVIINGGKENSDRSLRDYQYSSSETGPELADPAAVAPSKPRPKRKPKEKLAKGASESADSPGTPSDAAPRSAQ